MDLLKDYSESEDCSEDCDTSALAISIAPGFALQGKSHTAELQPPGKVQPPSDRWNPAGHAQYFAVGDSTFSRQEYAFGRDGVFNDPDTHELQRTGNVYAMHPESRVHLKRAKRSGAVAPDDLETARDNFAAQIASAPQIKRPRKERKQISSITVPSSELHVSADSDYLGRSWLEPQSDLRTFEDLEEYTAYIPKRCITEFEGAHKGGASAVRFFPRYGHLLLSAGLDGEAKIWDAGKRHQCIRSYKGHGKGIRDVCFSNDGATFLTASYDRTMKLWDTESGRVVSSFDGTKAIPFCIRFNPDEDKQNEFLAGCSDKKVLQMDIRDANNIMQQYDQHMGAVNSITFVDDNRRFVSSADDKVLRVWEYGIPVVIKYISDPKMHSMPVVEPHPNRKWLACQSMDNRVTVFSSRDRFKLNGKKSFRGHVVAGYACGLTFSPDGRFLASGDSIGRAFFWDWKTSQLFRSLQAHQGICKDISWHPTKSSLLATCGWDGAVKIWD